MNIVLPLNHRRQLRPFHAWTRLAALASAIALAPVVYSQAPDLSASAAQKENDEAKSAEPHQKFAPDSGDPAKRSGAAYTALIQRASDKPGVLTLSAHAGIGQSFPVQEEHQAKLFDVTVVAGDDSHLTLEIRHAEGAPQQKIDVPRDKTTRLEIGGRQLAFLFPMLPPQPGKPTSNQAMINVFLYPSEGAPVFPPNTARVASPERGTLLYSMKFDGGMVPEFFNVWKRAFPNDNFVMTYSTRNEDVPSFEIRNVRLAELARSIAFLTEGALTIEVVEKDATTAGNIWRIGRAPQTAVQHSAKMRAVAAPRLFASEQRLKRLLDDAGEIEKKRVDIIRQGEVSHDAYYLLSPTRVEPLSNQKVLVLIGSEDGITGLESFIKACEQTTAQQDIQDEEEKRSAALSRAIDERQNAALEIERARAAEAAKMKKSGK